jgi:transketolase
MEGISQEAASLAGHLGLGKLVWLYDDNQITIDGGTNLSFSDDTAAKFSALNWNVIHVDDGMNVDAVDRAISEAGNQSDRPTLIICKTVIGFGSPNKAGSSKVHGSPLGADELRLTKESLGLPTDVPFYFPDDLATEMNAKQPGASAESLWKEKFLQYSAQYPREAKEFLGETGTDWISNLPTFTEPLATRNATGAFLNSIKDVFPNLLSGSADLSDNVFTTLKDAGAQSRQTPEGRNIFYGVREHAMAAAANGISLHGGCKAVCGTFLIFSDYCKPSIRLAALMGCPTLFTFSHDSIGLGEDGPTHQPIEQLAMLRAIPGLSVYRPADANETVACWASAIQSVKPSVIVTSRQALPIVTSSDYKNHPSAHGGYVLRAESIDLKLILVATGSEVQLALSAASELEAEGIGTRVVNLVCWSVFDAQADEYRQKVLPKNVPTLAVEAQCEVGWHKYADEVLCMRSFGASAPAPTLFEKFGFTVENVVATAKRLLLSP